jgi:zinc transporter ZupT
MSESEDSGDNVGIALALVFGAGASTAIGAAVVFFPSLVKLASKRVLAGSLGFSAGVMTYVSFVEIFTKSRTSFEERHDENTAHLYATICFFAGVAIMMVSKIEGVIDTFHLCLVCCAVWLTLLSLHFFLS